MGVSRRRKATSDSASTHNELCTLRLLLRHLLRLNSGSVLSAEGQLRGNGVHVSARCRVDERQASLVPE